MKKEKPQKPAKKVPAKKRVDKEDIEEMEGMTSEMTGEKRPEGSALKAIGLNSYTLTCPSCKFKRKLAIKGEIKPYQLTCKKCGSEMKVSKH